MNRVWFWLGWLAVLLLLSQLLVHDPIELWAKNAGEFEFSGLAFAVMGLSVLAVGMATASAILLVAPRPLRAVLACLICAAALTGWAYARVLFQQSAVIDGRDRPFDFSTPFGTWELALVAGALLALAFIAWKLPRQAIVVLVVLQLGLAASTVLHLVVTASSKVSAFGRDTWPFWRLSTDKNVLIVLFDSLQSDVVAELMAQDPKLREEFAGFTLFRNTLGVAPTTFPSMPSIHSGRIFEPSERMTARYETGVVQGSFLNALAASGYETTLVNPVKNHCPLDIQLCTTRSALLEEEFSTLTVRTALLVDMALMRAAPYKWKDNIFNGHHWRLTAWLGGSYLLEAIVEDNRLLREAARKLVVTGGAPAAKFVHLISTHRPYVLDRNCALNRAGAFQRQSGAAGCALASLGDLITALKEKGVYESTIVAVIADHGAWEPSRYADEAARGEAGWASMVGAANPVLLVKPLRAEGPLNTSNTPVSIADLGATICALAGACDQRPGGSAFEPGGSGRDRIYHHYTPSHQQWILDRLSGITEYRVNAPLWQRSSWQNLTPANAYPLGSIISGVGSDFDRYGVSGWAQPDDWGRWSLGKDAELRLQVVGAGAGPLELQMNVRALILGWQTRQEVVVQANGEKLGTWVFDSFDIVERRAMIPARLLADGRPLDVTFRIASPLSPAELGIGPDLRPVGLGVAQFRLISAGTSN